MEERLTQVQFEKIVAEVEGLSQRQQNESSIEQVKEILKELNLPVELLEEAKIQLARSEALKAQKKRNRWIIASVIGVLVVLLIGITFGSEQQKQIVNNITVESKRITLKEDDGSNLKTIPAQTSSEIFYRITLSQAPVGQKLSLSCHWIAPNGEIAHQNNYETKTITNSTWNTFCRQSITPNTPKGTWKVQSFLGERLLSDATFTVQ